MNIPYDLFTEAFLAKVTEYDLPSLDDLTRDDVADGFMKRALVPFRKNCKYDLLGTQDDDARGFSVDIPVADLYEIVDIVSEGMIVQWLKPYVYKQELLENVLNTRDFSTFSPAELLHRVSETYEKSKKDYTNMIREYSYNHGDLTDLHI